MLTQNADYIGSARVLCDCLLLQTSDAAERVNYLFTSLPLRARLSTRNIKSNLSTYDRRARCIIDGGAPASKDAQIALALKMFG